MIRFVNLALALIIAEKNNMQHVLYPLSVLIVHRADRETLIISLKKDISRCALKVVVQITLLTFVIFLFMYNGNINEK